VCFNNLFGQVINTQKNKKQKREKVESLVQIEFKELMPYMLPYRLNDKTSLTTSDLHHFCNHILKF
jgi:hypothetical protein